MEHYGVNSGVVGHPTALLSMIFPDLSSFKETKKWSVLFCIVKKKKIYFPKTDWEMRTLS